MDADDDGYDEPWTDGHKPHRCGFFVEEHDLKYRKNPNGTATSYWRCPPHAPL